MKSDQSSSAAVKLTVLAIREREREREGGVGGTKETASSESRISVADWPNLSTHQKMH